MIRSRLTIPNLPLFLLAAAVVALLAFGATRWVVDRQAATLPALEVAGDSAAAAPGALDPAAVFQKRVDTTVTIEATIGDAPMNGAGVVVATDGTIVTASHVVKDYEHALDASVIVVRFHGGDEVVAKLVALDQFNDLAVLKVDPAQVKRGLRAAPLADSDKLLVGSPVMAIGAPFGYEFTPTLGNVSATHRVIDSRINAAYAIPDMIQFDAAINTGNSGGPLFNARGEVIGINQQIATPAKVNSGIAFAVSSNLVRETLRRLRETGSVDQPDLGLQAVSVTPQLAAAGQLAADRGALVQTAVGAAAQAGIAQGREIQHPATGKLVRLGDVIIELAGRKITSRDDLARVTALLDPNEPVEVTFLSAGERRTATITPTVRQIV